jgi:hypothetical protein
MVHPRAWRHAELERLPGDSPLARVAAWPERAVFSPFADILSRRGALVILGFVILYKFGDALAGTMSNSLYVLRDKRVRSQAAGFSQLQGVNFP